MNGPTSIRRSIIIPRHLLLQQNCHYARFLCGGEVSNIRPTSPRKCQSLRQHHHLLHLPASHSCIHRIAPSSCRFHSTTSSSPANSTSSLSNRRDPIITDEGLVLHQADPSQKTGGNGLVWGSVLWPSGVSLAKYLHYYSKNNNKNMSVLELGCGTGIVGLTLAKCLPTTAQVTLTDSESALWPLLHQNIHANFVKNVRIANLDWRDTSTFLSADNFDLIVAADVLYAGMDKLFARALASHLLDNDSLVACPFRQDSPLVGFFGACHRLGLAVERLEDDDGNASGAHFGRDAFEAYRNSQFVALTESNMEHVTESPTFAPGNDQKVQIFRIYRVKGEPEDAIRIKRVNRI